MQLIFLNPWGWLALLGIPAVLAIHLLQRKARETPITTMFLLESLPQQSVAGRRLERLRQSVPLWTQLLFVILLTMLLTQPRWTRATAVQRIALVLDASASMGAQVEETREALQRVLPGLARRAGTTEWLVMDSLPDSGARDRTTELSEVMEKVASRTWNAPSHSPDRSLKLARQLIGSEGLLVWVTDRSGKQLPPVRAVVLSGARPKANVGFSGGRVSRADSGETRWEALVHHHGEGVAPREWWIESVDGSVVGQRREIRLEADSSIRLEGGFPDGQDRLVLCLQADELGIDDRLPLVNPAPAPLPVWLAPELAGEEQPWERILSSLERVPMVADPGRALLRIARHSDAALQLEPPAAAVHVASAPALDAGWLAGDAAVDTHQLVEELNWQGLAFAETSGAARGEESVPLLWLGQRCLIWLDGDRRRPALHFDFDPGRSNTDRMASLVVLVQRYVDMLRERSGGFARANVEVRSLLPLGRTLASGADGAEMDEWVMVAGGEEGEVLRAADGRLVMRAPSAPGLFEVKRGDRPAFHGAAQFTDLAQLDLREAAVSDPQDELDMAMVDQVRRARGGMDLAFLVPLIGCVLLSWWWPVRRSGMAGSRRPWDRLSAKGGGS